MRSLHVEVFLPH